MNDKLNWIEIVEVFNNKDVMKVLTDWGKSMDKRNKKGRPKKKFQRIISDEPPKLSEDDISRK